MIIDGAVLTEPRAWHVTKINRIAPNGIARITLAQDFFDQHKDYIELDSDGNVIGMWADYYSSSVEPEDPGVNIPTSNIYSKISYAGLKSEIKVGGSYKKFSVDFFNNDTPAPFETGTWTFTIDGASAPVTTSTVGLDPNQIKVRFDGNSSYIGKVLKINYLSTSGISSDLEVSIIAL